MDIFKSCNIVEKSGHGVPKVVATYGKEAFKFSPHRITVTIPFDKNGFENSAQESAQESTNDGRIFNLIKSNPLITRKELMNKTGLSDGGIKKIISKLKIRDL